MYGEGRNTRFFLGIGLVIVLLFFVIFLIMHSGGGSKVPETKRELTSYVNDSNAAVVETIIGPITATDQHDEVQITVTNSQTTIEVSKGYDGNVVNSRSYPLSTNGFSEFLYALQRSGYTKGDTAEDLKNDQGYCPEGDRYIFEVRDGADTIQRFWATSCKSTKTFHGDLGTALSLFEAQIPDYDDLLQDTNL